MDRGVPDMPGELVSEEVGIFLKSKVSQILKTRLRDFPGSQPVSFTRDHLYNNLFNRDYLVCEKSDGLRCLLLVLINQDTGEEGTFLINRENQYYMVPGFHFPKNSRNFDVSHNGTIVDGELVYSTNQATGIKELRYLIFDCLAMDMNSVMQKNLWKRLYHAQHDFHKPYMELRRAFPDACAQFPFKLDFKNMTQPFKIKKIFKEMKNLTYVSDGLILTCCDTPYCSGTDPTLLKWKPAEENTIDFKIGLKFPSYIDSDLPNDDPNKEYTNYDTKPFVKLYIWKGSNNNNNNTSTNGNTQNGDLEDSINYKNSFDEYEEYDDLEISDEVWENWKNSGESFHGRIAEVRRNNDGKWEYLRFRDDKLNGNYYTIVLKILKSIEDAVSKEELINAEKDIWENWQKREKHKKEIQQQQQQNPHHPPPHQQQHPHSHQQQQHSHHADHAPHPRRESQPHQMEVPVTDATKKRLHDGNKNGHSDHHDDVPVTGGDGGYRDEDDDYESDGFEEIPTYNRESPKYGDMDHENKKRKY